MQYIVKEVLIALYKDIILPSMITGSGMEIFVFINRDGWLSGPAIQIRPVFH